MTILAIPPRQSFAGNGVTTAFPVPFDFFGADELRVIERDNATGAEVPLALGVGFAVAGGNGDAGTVTTTAAPAVGTTLFILRSTKRTQEVDYVSADPFPAETHELALDRLTAIAQELEREIERTVRVPETETGFVLPPSASRADNVLAFDANGNPTLLPVVGGGITGPAGPQGPAGQGAPIGTLAPWAGNAAPTGWLLAHGQAVSRTAFPDLFAVLGVTYGAGDGATTFNLPDLRGRFVLGRDNMGGSAANRVTAAVSGVPATTLGGVGGDERLQQHAHGVTDPGHPHSGSTNITGDHNHVVTADVTNAFTGIGSGLSGSGDVGIGDTATTTSGAHAHTVTVNSGLTNISIQNAGAGGAQNIPPAIVLNFIICAQNVAAGPSGPAVPANAIPAEIGIACSDETTNLTTGTAVVTFRMPHAMTMQGVRASLSTASSSGVVDVDVKEGGVSIFSTRLTINANEKTSVTAATAAVISDLSLADDAEITVDIVAAGTGARGLKVWLLGTRSL